MSLGGIVCSLIVCPKGHTIVLPRQTPLRMFPNQQSPPTEKLKAIFLCTECEVQFSCSPEDFRIHRIERQGRDHPIPLLWHIAGECVIGNCEKLKPIFFGYDASGKEGVVRQYVLGLVGEMECSAGHRQWVTGDMPQIEVIPIARQSD